MKQNQRRKVRTWDEKEQEKEKREHKSLKLQYENLLKRQKRETEKELKFRELKIMADEKE